MAADQGAPDAGVPDPSMDDILASIRRILNDGDAPAAASAAPPAAPAQPAAEDVYLLDAAMLIEEGPAAAPVPAPANSPVAMSEPAAVAAEPMEVMSEPTAMMPEPRPAAAVAPPEPPLPHALPEAQSEPLLTAHAAEAASSAMGPLMQALRGRATQVHRGGPTLEDLVRSELRPVLAEWLDQHLPGIVERLVKAEVERLTNGVP